MQVLPPVTHSLSVAPQHQTNLLPAIALAGLCVGACACVCLFDGLAGAGIYSEIRQNTSQDKKCVVLDCVPLDGCVALLLAAHMVAQCTQAISCLATTHLQLPQLVVLLLRPGTLCRQGVTNQQ